MAAIKQAHTQLLLYNQLVSVVITGVWCMSVITQTEREIITTYKLDDCVYTAVWTVCTIGLTVIALYLLVVFTPSPRNHISMHISMFSLHILTWLSSQKTWSRNKLNQAHGSTWRTKTEATRYLTKQYFIIYTCPQSLLLCGMQAYNTDLDDEIIVLALH